LPLASFNRRSENIAVEAVVVAELKFRDVQRHIFAADLVERAHDTALEDAPEALNGLSVDSADDVLLLGMVNGAMGEFITQMRVADPLVGAEQADLFGHSLIDESLQGLSLHIRDDASDDIALSLDCADDDCPFAASRWAGQSVALVGVLVLGLAADESFINLDNAAKFCFGLNESGADFVTHGMCRAVATEAHDALDLKGAYSLLAGQHRMGDAEPVTQGLVRVLKDGACRMREAIAGIWRTLVALPFVRHRSDRKDLYGTAARANDAFRPTPLHQIRLARFFIWEHRLELSDGHLVNWLRSAGHLAIPVYGGEYGM
jgi:hypothetical protein